MANNKQSWDDLVEQHRAAYEMSDDDAATLWNKIVLERPEAKNLILVDFRPSSGNARRSLPWYKRLIERLRI